jgi:hypothetical protein
MGTDVGAGFDCIEQALAWFVIIGMEVVILSQATAAPGGRGHVVEKFFINDLH